MRNYSTETNRHGSVTRFIEYVKDHYAFDGIRNETWMYLNEHEPTAGDLEVKDNLIPFSDFDIYRMIS